MLDAVTGGQLQDACQKMMKSPPSVAAFGNLQGMPSLSEVSSVIGSFGKIWPEGRRIWPF
jgi:hypothetical protein